MMAVGTCEARKADPEKELIGDLLRNAGLRFGIGTKLWSKAADAEPAALVITYRCLPAQRVALKQRRGCRPAPR